jgi:V8-like Glu-specific endopeptidase
MRRSSNFRVISLNRLFKFGRTFDFCLFRLIYNFLFSMALLIFLLGLSGRVEAAIYGSDDRQDVNQVAGLRDISAAVAVLVANNFIQLNADSTYQITDVRTAARGGLCSSERFADQPSIGLCTGFLVAPNILVTAGHCVSNEGVNATSKEYCDAFSWYFDYQLDKNGAVDYEHISKDRIYRCKQALWTENHSNYPYDILNVGLEPDFAVIELERDVVGITPLRFSTDLVSKGDSIYTIGHPWGLPAKYSGQSQVVRTDFATAFSANLDTLGGNSGGPVFNDKNQVIGILTAGHQHDSWKSNQTPVLDQRMSPTCERINHCRDDATHCDRSSDLFTSNEIQKIDVVRGYIPFKTSWL